MSDPFELVIAAARLLPAALLLGALAGRSGWLSSAWLLALVGFVVPASASDAGPLLRLLLELAVGTAFALALCGPVLAARHAGRMLELGYGVQWGRDGGALRGLYGWCFLALFAALGGLRLWSRALVEVPPALALDDAQLGALAVAAATFCTQLLRLALVVAAPAWIAFVLLDLGMALVGRLSAGPGRAIVGLSMPLRLASVVVALPLSAERLPGWARLARQAASRWAQDLLS